MCLEVFQTLFLYESIACKAWIQWLYYSGFGARKMQRLPFLWGAIVPTFLMKHDETVAATSLIMLNRSWSVLGSEQSYGRNKLLSWHICMALSLSWTFGMAMERARERETHVYWILTNSEPKCVHLGWEDGLSVGFTEVTEFTTCDTRHVKTHAFPRFPKEELQPGDGPVALATLQKNPRNPNHLAKENVK